MSGSDVSFNRVTGLAFVDSENLYSVNQADNLIIKTNSSGVSTNITQTSSNNLSSPAGLAYDSTRNLFFCANNGNNTISLIDVSGNTSSFTNSGLFGPYGLAYESNTQILYCANSNTDNSGNYTVVKINPSTGIVTPFASSNLLNQPRGLALNPLDNTTLYCSNFGNNTVVTINISSGVVSSFAPTLDSDISLNSPIGLAFDTSGKLYCSNSYTNAPSIVAIDGSGNVTNVCDFTGSTTYFLTMQSNFLYFGDEAGYIQRTNEAVCFNEDTKILCLNHMLEEEYIPIQHLKKGDLVKTYLHGYRKVDLTHKGILFNNPNERRKCMYKMEKTDENRVLEDLIVTGGHSILVDSISESEKEKLYKLGLNDYIDKIDDKYLVLASVSDHFIPLINNNIYNYYHFTLESDDDKQRFGIWANGILTETTCNNYLLKHR